MTFTVIYSEDRHGELYIRREDIESIECTSRDGYGLLITHSGRLYNILVTDKVRKKFGFGKSDWYQEQTTNEQNKETMSNRLNE